MNKLVEAINMVEHSVMIWNYVSDIKTLALLREHKEEVNDFFTKDSVKTREINVLVKENRTLTQENEKLRKAVLLYYDFIDSVMVAH